MRHETIQMDEMLEMETVSAADVIGSADQNGRYDLALALRVVRKMETSAARGAVFSEIIGKNPAYRLVTRIYELGGVALQPLALFAYMLKSVLSIGPTPPSSVSAVSISNFDNEHRAITRVLCLVPDVEVHQLTLKRGHVLGRGQLRAIFRLIAAIPRIWPYLIKLARAHSFMPAARIASTLAFYMRLTWLLQDMPGASAAIIASNYSPESVGMAAAAHKNGRRVIYVNHAPVPANGASVPPVLADCAVLYGDAIRATYEAKSRCIAEVALIGQSGEAKPIEWREQVQTVGIFLTALTRADKVEALVAAIKTSKPDMRIIIRNHPVALLKSDFGSLARRYNGVEVTIGNPLDQEIAACDMVICGNSGVTMNALRGGRPVAYIDALDNVSYDYNGFVASGLVYPANDWSDDLYPCLAQFYQAAEWQDVMAFYDASYGQDIEEVAQAASRVIRRYITAPAFPS